MPVWHSHTNLTFKNDEESVAHLSKMAQFDALFECLEHHDFVHLHLVISSQKRLAIARCLLKVISLLLLHEELYILDHVTVDVFIVLRASLFWWLL